MNTDLTQFEEMFRASDDPWHFRTRWYEERKRALTMAALPRPRYASGFEPGCANGELSALLAERCDRLLAADATQAAAALARRRLAPFGHARVAELMLPAQWPDERFDLIVLSELGYYFDEPMLHALCRKTIASLADDGTWLACHWRSAIEGSALDGDGVHALLAEHAAEAGLVRLLRHLEDDFVLEAWSKDARSVAAQDGLR